VSLIHAHLNFIQSISTWYQIHEWGKGFVIENQSPYYLHPSEGHGVTITSVIFNGKNYELWQKAVKIALK